MERLISDANEYAKSIGQAGNLSINSFSDIVDAIDLVQQKQQIAGTTAREASTTIEGALTMTKSAWDNLVAGLADPDADIGKLIDNFVESAGALGQNLMPVIQQALTSIANLAGKIGPVLSKQLPKAIKSVLPSILSAAVNLVSGLIAALPGILSALGAAIPAVISAVMDNASGLLEAGKNLLNMLVKGITQGIPMLVTGLQSVLSNIGTFLQSNMSNLFSSGLDIVGNIVKMIRTQAGRLVDSGCELLVKLAGGFADSIPVLIEKVPAIISDLAGIINDNAPKLIACGIEIIAKLAIGLVKAIPTLIANLPKIIKAIWDVFTAIQWWNLGKTIIQGLANGLKNMAPKAISACKNIGKNILNFFKTLPGNLKTIGSNAIKFLVNGIKSLAGAAKNAAVSIFKGIVNAFKSLPSNLGSIAKGAFNLFVSGIRLYIGIVKGVIKGITNAIISILTAINPKMGEIGSNLIKGLWNGINNMAGWIKSKIQGFGKGVLNALKSFFGIHSPSKLMEKEVGVYIAQGVAVGIVKGSKSTEDAVQTLGKVVMDATKKMTKKTIKAAKTEAAKISAGILSGFKSAKTYGDYIVSAAKKRLDEFEKNNKLTTDEEIKFWKRLRKNYAEGSSAYEKITKKITKLKQQQAKEAEEADEKMVSNAETKLEKQKFYHDLTLSDEVAYWDRIVKQTKKGTEARYQADQKYADAKKALDDKVLEEQQNYADKVKEVNDKLASDIDAAWQKYTDAWNTSFDNMLGKFSQLEEFTRKDVVGIGQLTQNIQDSNDATREYEQYIALLASNPLIPEALLEQIKGFGVENVETIKAIAEATPEQLQAYINAWNEKVQLATTYADTENAKLLQDTQRDVEALKAKASADIDELGDNYVAAMEKLGIKLEKPATQIGEKIVNGVTFAVDNGESKTSDQIKRTTNKAIDSAKKAINGKSIGNKIVSDTIAAIKSGQGAISSTLSSIVSSAVSAAISEARAAAASAADQVSTSNTMQAAAAGAGNTVVNVNVDKLMKSPAQIIQETKTAIRFAGIKAR